MEAPGTRTLLTRTLKDLDPEQLADFRASLRERRGDGPRVRRADVEGKSPLELSELLVQTFCRDGAVSVTVQLLRDIGCMDTAAELVADAAATDPVLRPDQHFVDRYREQLIHRVTNINPVLDRLHQQGALQGEQYDLIRTLRTTQEQMRTLYCSALRSGGLRSKDLLLEALEEHESFLIEELRQRG